MFLAVCAKDRSENPLRLAKIAADSLTRVIEGRAQIKNATLTNGVLF